MTTLLLTLLLQAEAVRTPDPSHLDVAWPRHSHRKVPWRAWLETRPAVDFLAGIGIVYNVRKNDALAVRLLAEAGIRAARREVGWASVAWDETRLNDEARFREQLRLFKKHGIRPTFLLNCHQGAPCPVRFFEGRLAGDAPAGATTVRLEGVKDVVPGRTGLSNLSDYWAAEALITAFDPATGTATLAKPLPKALPAGKIPMATLKYLPLHPPGTPEFDETSAGWVRYARLVLRIAAEEGLEDVDLEIYNELTFGTRFLDARHYLPSIPKPKADFLHEGGTCWELGRRIVEAAAASHPRARCLWGFSNTTFFHTDVRKLPPGMAGQSYHPYGTGTRDLRAQEPHKKNPEFNVDGWTPPIEVRIPEGVASTLIQTECILRLLEPSVRVRAPKGVDRFRHYMTEHGVLAKECGVTDDAGAWTLKTACALRSWCLWLNKGVDVLHYYSAFYPKAGEFGLLPVDLERLPADATFEQAATPPLRALRALTAAFAGAVPLEKTAPLAVEVEPAGATGVVYAGDAAHPPLRHADVVAFLPWQVDARTHAAAVYVAAWDVMKPVKEERYRLRISGAAPGAARLLDPVTGRELPVERRPDGALELPLTDIPRILVLKAD